MSQIMTVVKKIIHFLGMNLRSFSDVFGTKKFEENFHMQFDLKLT